MGAGHSQVVNKHCGVLFVGLPGAGKSSAINKLLCLHGQTSDATAATASYCEGTVTQANDTYYDHTLNLLLIDTPGCESWPPFIVKDDQVRPLPHPGDQDMRCHIKVIVFVHNTCCTFGMARLFAACEIVIPEDVQLVVLLTHTASDPPASLELTDSSSHWCTQIIRKRLGPDRLKVFETIDDLAAHLQGCE